MSSMFGKRLHLALFGESHGEAVGMVLDGLPAGMAMNEERIQAMLLRRAGGKSELSTARAEKDRPRFVSGIYHGATNGAPICALFDNGDVKPDDDALLAAFARPSHADFPAHEKHSGFNDPRGGGHCSARLTASEAPAVKPGRNSPKPSEAMPIPIMIECSVLASMITAAPAAGVVRARPVRLRSAPATKR